MKKKLKYFNPRVGWCGSLVGRDWGSPPQLSYWGDITVRFIITDCCLLFYRESEVAGYVYYEVDNFDDIRNPFMSLETEDPSMARVRSSPPERERRITRARFHKEQTRSKQRPVGSLDDQAGSL